MKKLPLVSIIVRTKNEEKWIESCLKRIENQSINSKNIEIIIVDNNSSDQTISRAKKYKVKIFFIKKYLPGKALNYGIKKAKGKYIVCLSAHCIPANKDWLKHLLISLKSNKVAGVYGRQIPLPYSSDFDKRDLINLFGQDKKIQIKDTFFHNANSAFRKAVWKKYKFDENTEHIEDRIWGHKVIKNGFKIIYEPKAVVYHWHGINQEMDAQRCSKIVNILESLGQEYKTKHFDSIENLNCIAIIPLRGESIKINKNNFLLEVTINDLKKSKYVNNIYIATDNKKNILISKKYGVKAPFLRPKYFSDDHVDINTILSFYLNKIDIDNKNHTDVVVVATENFPLRSKNIFDKMIEKLFNKNLDCVFAYKKEKGTVFIKKEEVINRIVDGSIPKKINPEVVLISRIGVGFVCRANHLRAGKLYSGRVGYLEVENDFSMIEIDNPSIPDFVKNQIIQKLINNS
jgi:glycosyltransferase involved in cell wall biosynthesis